MKLKKYFHEIKLGGKFWVNNLEYKKILPVYYQVNTPETTQTNKENAINCTYFCLAYFPPNNIVFVETDPNDDQIGELFSKIKGQINGIREAVDNFGLE